MRELAVGVDCGGTFTKVAAVTTRGKIALEAELPAEVEAGPSALVDRVCALLERWRSERRVRAASVGIGLAGDVDSARGGLRLAPNLPGWARFDFRRAFARRLKVSVAVENDASAAVWGAYVAELGRRPKHVIGATLGTGVGGGLVLDGSLFRGTSGSAGEIGHMRVGDDGAPCHCGNTGCLEAYAGSYGIARTARRLLELDPEGGRALRELCPDLDALEPRHLTQAAEAGDRVARETWRVTGRTLGIALGNLVLVLNPDVLLILGGVSRAGRWIVDPIREVLDAQPFRTPFARARLRLTASPKAGAVGAALLGLEGRD